MTTPKKTASGRVMPKKPPAKAKLEQPEELVIRQGSLTRREMAEIEALSGKSIRELHHDDGTPSTEFITLTTYIRLREGQPTITLDEVWDMPFDVEFKTVGSPVPTKAASSQS